MWPSKEGLGIQLGYGVYGNGIPEFDKGYSKEKSSKSKLNLELKFPRVRDGGLHFNRVRLSYTELVEKQIGFTDSDIVVHGEDKSFSRRKRNTKSALQSRESIYIPQDILKSYLIESESLKSPGVHDPTYGSICVIFKVCNCSSDELRPVLAHVAGDSGSILNLSVLDYRIRSLQLSERTGKPEENLRLLAPQLLEPVQIQMTESIKQITTSQIEGSNTSCIIVRTDLRLYFLGCSIVQGSDDTYKINLAGLGEITSADLHGFNFADVTFNTENSSQFAVVDVRGNFNVGTVDTDADIDGNIKLLSWPKEEDNEKCAIFDVKELSNWKRVIWASGYNDVLLLSRSLMVRIDTKKHTSQKIVTAGTWSHIQDIAQLPSDSNQLFMLTSKELIWIDMSHSGKRVLSWKHFLEGNDPSLKLHLKEVERGKLFICFVYSKIMPIILVYNFGVVDDRPYSLRDPYYLRSESSKGRAGEPRLHEILFHEIDEEFYSLGKEKDLRRGIGNENLMVDGSIYGLFEFSTDLALSVNFYTDKENFHLEKEADFVTNLNSRGESSSPSVSPFQNVRKTAFSMLKKREIKKLLEKVGVKTQNCESKEQVSLIQDYAFKLGEGLPKIEQTQKNKSTSTNFSTSLYRSLIDIAGKPPFGILNLEEFISMIDQLEEFFESRDIEIKKDLKVLQQLSFNKPLENENEQNTKQFFDDVKSVYLGTERMRSINDIKFCCFSVAHLIGSLIKARPKDAASSVRELTEDALGSCTSEIKDLLNDWDSPNDITQIHDRNKINFELTDTQMSVPTIKITQNEVSALLEAKYNHVSQSQANLSSQMMSSTQETASRHHEEIVSSSYDHFSSQNIPSSLAFSMSSQKRLGASQNLSSRQRHKRKKKKGGFA